MPIYEFTCPGCGNEFEKLVMGGSVAVACPACGADEHLRRGWRGGGVLEPWVRQRPDLLRRLTELRLSVSGPVGPTPLPRLLLQTEPRRLLPSP